MIKVFYSGTWDLFHHGHLRALEAAAALGDWLTVGVITDDFARSYKDAPAIPYEQRAVIIASLRCVDEVVAHISWTDNSWFMRLGNFDIRVIGPEHGVQHDRQRRVRRTLEAAGLKYVVIPRTPDISTTLIKERIRNEKD